MLFVLSQFPGCPHWMKGLSSGHSLLVGLHYWGKRRPRFKALGKKFTEFASVVFSLFLIFLIKKNSVILHFLREQA